MMADRDRIIVRIAINIFFMFYSQLLNIMVIFKINYTHNRSGLLDSMLTDS